MEGNALGFGLMLVAFGRLQNEKLRWQREKYGYDEKYIDSFKMTIPFAEREFFTAIDRMSEFDSYIRNSGYSERFFNGIPSEAVAEDIAGDCNEFIRGLYLDFEKIGFGVDLSRHSIPSGCKSYCKADEEQVLNQDRVAPGWRL